jgi:hypothetical protein
MRPARFWPNRWAGVFFAGEAVVDRYPTLVTAAHLSGERAADEAIARLGGPVDCGACEARSAKRDRLLDAFR